MNEPFGKFTYPLTIFLIVAGVLVPASTTELSAAPVVKSTVAVTFLFNLTKSTLFCAHFLARFAVFTIKS